MNCSLFAGVGGVTITRTLPFFSALPKITGHEGETWIEISESIDAEGLIDHILDELWRIC